MFIGGSSASTAGGVKTSTLFIMLLSAYTTIKGNKKLEAFKRNISLELLHKAFTIFGFATLFVLTGIFALSIIEPDIDLVDLAFEEISAFGTTGLSRGITAQLSDSGKVCLLISMFVGRVSTLALFFSLSTPQTSYSHKYPDTNFMIG
ncbi:MAG: hypothetical protein JKY33_04825 [Bacteroidia bacterium]|nr:hypothetical protein [Bacteroidia bacterium]